MSLLVLRTQGFKACAAANAHAAFLHACEERPDVIVTDLAMPEGDGWELIEKLSSDPRTKEIPVVMLTACATTELNRQLAEDWRLAAFFFKPCAPDVLAAELRRLCDSRQSNVA